MDVDTTASLGNLFQYLTFLTVQIFLLYLIRISLCTVTTGSCSFAVSLRVQLCLCVAVGCSYTCPYLPLFWGKEFPQPLLAPPALRPSGLTQVY